ncbi:MAG: hypothetical protein ACREIV_09680 [Planctomycetaceae bacterium]
MRLISPLELIVSLLVLANMATAAEPQGPDLHGAAAWPEGEAEDLPPGRSEWFPLAEPRRLAQFDGNLPPGELPAQPEALFFPELQEEPQIHDLRIDIRGSAGLTPESAANPAAEEFSRYGVVFAPQGDVREWLAHTFHGQASSFCHRPLYFEELYVERYGHSLGHLQPFASAAHFYGTVPLLPYKMWIEPPWECVYTMHHMRVDTCGPPAPPRPPFRLDAAAVQAGVTAGLILVVP